MCGFVGCHFGAPSLVFWHTVGWYVLTASLLRAQFHSELVKQMNFLCSPRHDRRNFQASGQTGFQAWAEIYWPGHVGAPWSLSSCSTVTLEESTCREPLYSYPVLELKVAAAAAERLELDAHGGVGVRARRAETLL